LQSPIKDFDMKVLRPCLTVLTVLYFVTAAVVAQEPAAWTTQNLPQLIELYRHLHAHPELSYQEEQTAARLAAELEAVGATVTTNVGGFGVVALLKNGDGPTVMMRCDMDALPVEEQTNLVYASKVRVKTHGA